MKHLFSRAGLALGAMALVACSTPTGPKMAELKPIPNGVTVKTLWSLSMGSGEGVALTPAVSGTSLFVANKDGDLARIDEGQITWKIKTGKPLSGGVGAESGLVVVGTPKAQVLAFSTINGEARWTAQATSEVLAPPAVAGRVVVVKSGDNKIVALDANDGRRKWVYQRNTPPLSVRSAAAPVVADRYVFTGFPGGKMVALLMDNGGPVWEGSVAIPKGATELERVADVVSSPFLDSRLLCGAAYQGRVACFEINRSGNMVWSRDIPAGPGITGDLRQLYVADDKGTVHGLEKSSGQTVWTQPGLAHRKLTAPVAYGSMVAVGDSQGYVHFLSKDNGRFMGRVQVDSSPIVVPPVVMGTALIVQSTKGGLYALETQ